MLELGIEGFSWPDLHDPAGLRALYEHFDGWLEESDPEARALLERWRRDSDGLPGREVSAAIVAVAPWVGRFVARLFRVEREVDARSRSIAIEEPVFAFRKAVAKKRVVDAKSAPAWDAPIVRAHEIVARFGAAFAPEERDEERRIAIASLRVHAIDETARKVARGGGATWTDALREDAARLRAALEAPSLDDDGGALDDGALDDGALAAHVL
ncbi:MAG: hypothetical protein M3Y87_34685, partial [Myxococcota bacterium]|nr:hypothetical protein [Myxococcota bacterium]